MGDEGIMIVEDRESISNAIKEMLTLKGKKVVAIASTGEEAMRMFMDERPGTVLMDILLPDMSGLEVTRRILEMEPDTRVIAMSAMSEPGIRERSLEAGCTDLLVKPFRMKELFEMIGAA